MRGAGRSERTVRDSVATMQRLERNAGKGCDQLAPVDMSRFLADPDLGASSRAAHFGTNITARLPWPRSPKLSPRPVSGPGLS